MMSDIPAAEIMELLERANNMGIKISYDKLQLKVILTKPGNADPGMLAELKQKRGLLLRYLSQFKADQKDSIDNTKNYLNCIEYKGRYYYDITSTQDYWANDNKDKEYKEKEDVHGNIRICYRVTGDFNPLLFKQAVAYIVSRHESLRVTFHKINGTNKIRVEPADEQEIEIIDLRNIVQEGPGGLEDLIKFKGHQFSLSAGPLFLLRIFHTKDREYYISFKLHHIIADAWSVEILLNDLLKVYESFVDNKQPVLSELKYQYKELLGFINYCKARNYEAHRKYLLDTYPGRPPDLVMPGSRPVDSLKLENRIRKRMNIHFPEALLRRLNTLSKEYSASLFVVLQATFKTFLYCKTLQNDITIGTHVSGRDIPETNDQIGCYAGTVLIRSVFDEKDTFSDAILKVKKSNSDMAHYKAFTLFDAIEVQHPRIRQYEGFWKVNMLYTDMRGSFATERGLGCLDERRGTDFIPVMEKNNALMPIDMILEFLYLKDKLILDLQYDSSLYDEATIRSLIDDYLNHTHIVTADIYSVLRKNESNI